jgi:broad specificity phosphatase PhoE
MSSILIPAILAWSEPITWSNPTPQETIFLVMRHGETFGNNSSEETTYTYTGSQTNFPLNRNGSIQVDQVAEKIKTLYALEKVKISAIYSSPLLRAIQTASPIATALNLPLETRDDLREINWGIADGKLVKEIDEIWDEEEKRVEALDIPRSQKWDLLPVFPNAEKFNQVLTRVTSELKDIAEKHKGQIVLIATHGRVVKCITAATLDLDDNSIPYPKNAGIVVFRYSKEQPLQCIEVRDNK